MVFYYEDGRLNDNANILGDKLDSKSEETSESLTNIHSSDQRTELKCEPRRAVYVPEHNHNADED